MNEIQYIDRSTGNKKIENVPSGGTLKFLYGNPLGKLALHLLFKRKFFSVWGGWYMNRSQSKKRIEPFIKEHQIDMSEYHVPEKGFEHFNDFFYRKIKSEKRPIGKGVISPADGKILVFDKTNDTQKFFIKGSELNIHEFINNKSISDKYVGGSMAIVRLAPPDYHRFHFPVQGTVGNNTVINGSYFSVSPLALRKSLNIFLQNQREYCEVNSDEFGDVLIMDVGATLTGSIIQTFEENSAINKGQEKGYFAFGGSTTVILFQKNKVQFAPDLIQNTLDGFETTILMGESIAEAIQ